MVREKNYIFKGEGGGDEEKPPKPLPPTNQTTDKNRKAVNNPSHAAKPPPCLYRMVPLLSTVQAGRVAEACSTSTKEEAVKNEAFTPLSVFFGKNKRGAR